MLSKSAARKFFLLGTAVCAGAFVLLTLDTTIRKVPSQIHVEKLTESSIRGKHLFDRNNCMGCHTILGEGAYYAPELTKVYERRGPDYIKAMLKDPQAMFPGQRKMVKYDFSEQDREDLVEFFKWIGEMDLNGFPPKPDLGIAQAQAAPAQNAAAQGAPEVAKPAKFAICVACHSLGGQGGAVGPALDGVGSRRDHEFLVKWLKDPMAVKADSKMPKLDLADAEIEELATFLSGQK